MPKSSPKLKPQLLQLESRDVPATFYVDPLLIAAPNNSTQTFNAGKPNQQTGLLYGTSAATPNAKVFSSFNAAVDAAFASAGADTIFLANGDIPVNNTLGTVFINDKITLVGSGTAVTTLKPTADTADEQTAVIEVEPGQLLAASQFTFDGAGKAIGNGIVLSASTGLFNGVSIKNTVFDTEYGNGLFASNGSAFLFRDGSVSGYRRVGLAFQDSIGTVDNTTVTGLGLYNADIPNYGVQISGGSIVEVFGSRINDNRAMDVNGFQSFGVWLFEDLGLAPTAKITRTEFSNNTTAVVVGAARGADASVATINNNNFFSTNAIGVEAANNTTVDAKSNFWGSRTGPSLSPLNPGGTGTAVDDQVDFLPFLREVFNKPTEFVTAAGDQGGLVRIYNGDFSIRSTFSPFNNTYKGAVSVAAGDVNGDGVNDAIVGIGPSTTSVNSARVQVADGKTGVVIRDFSAYSGGYTGGVNVASGDFNGDGYSDIVVTTRAGTFPQVRIFDGVTGSMVKEFLAYAPSFQGGVNVAVADVDFDGVADVITGAATGGAPHVRVFRGSDSGLIQEFFAFGVNFLGGVNVSAGDINGDGRADIFVAPMFGSTQVRVFQTNLDGTMTRNANGTPTFVASQFFADVPNTVAGMNITARDLNGDGLSDLVYANRAGTLSDSKFRIVFNTNLFSANPTHLTSADLFDPTFGLNVG